MANIYDQNVKLQAIADAITNQSITITTGQDLLDALADIANAMQPAAANISYDNTNSGLQAVNVQQAVDENADEISTLNSSYSALYELDYANKVDLSQTLNVSGATYTVPKKGIIRVLTNNTANGDAYYTLRNMSISTSGYTGYIAYQRSYQETEGCLSESIVNIGDVIKCESIFNKTLNLCIFIPFK